MTIARERKMVALMKRAIEHMKKFNSVKSDNPQVLKIKQRYAGKIEAFISILDYVQGVDVTLKMDTEGFQNREVGNDGKS